jgi:hypothetical protein
MLILYLRYHAAGHFPVQGWSAPVAFSLLWHSRSTVRRDPTRAAVLLCDEVFGESALQFAAAGDNSFAAEFADRQAFRADQIIDPVNTDAQKVGNSLRASQQIVARRCLCLVRRGVFCGWRSVAARFTDEPAGGGGYHAFVRGARTRLQLLFDGTGHGAALLAVSRYTASSENNCTNRQIAERKKSAI